MDYEAAFAVLSAAVVFFTTGWWYRGRFESRRGVAASRPGNAWARMDFVAPRPSPVNTSVVKVTDWEDAPELHLEDHTITFTNVPDRSGIRRDLTYSAAMVMRFFKCDTPTRTEWRGDNNEYGRLLAIGRHYAWVLQDGRGVCWSVTMQTRERRLRILTAWLSAGK